MAMGLSMVQVPCEVGQNHAMTMSFFSCNPSVNTAGSEQFRDCK